VDQDILLVPLGTEVPCTSYTVHYPPCTAGYSVCLYRLYSTLSSLYHWCSGSLHSAQVIKYIILLVPMVRRFPAQIVHYAPLYHWVLRFPAQVIQYIILLAHCWVLNLPVQVLQYTILFVPLVLRFPAQVIQYIVLLSLLGTQFACTGYTVHYPLCTTCAQFCCTGYKVHYPPCANGAQVPCTDCTLSSFVPMDTQVPCKRYKLYSTLSSLYQWVLRCPAQVVEYTIHLVPLGTQVPCTGYTVHHPPCTMGKLGRENFFDISRILILSLIYLKSRAV
jgi:hypothetical protein